MSYGRLLLVWELQGELLEWGRNVERRMNIKAGLETERNTGVKGHTIIRVKGYRRLVKKLPLDGQDLCSVCAKLVISLV